MLVTLALVVFGSAILVFFSEELAVAFKKMLAFPGVKLFLPPMLVTQFLLIAEPQVVSFLLIMQEFFDLVTHGLDYFLPVNPLMRIASQATGLWLLAMLPIWILDAWSFRKTYKTFSYKAILSALLWLLWAIVFVLLVSNQ